MNSLVETIAEPLGLTNLSKNIHYILGAAFFYQIVYLLGGYLSSVFFGRVYNHLEPKVQMKWRIKITSFVNASLISYLSFSLLFDEHLQKDKVFNSTDYSEFVYSMACGYFLWDIVYAIVEGQGFGFLLHGVSCFSVYLFSFTPFLNYYGSVFLMFELSTPFLDFIFFMDKSGNSDSILMVINGICLMVVFFCVRIVFGIYMSYKTFESVLQVISKVPLHLQFIYGTANVALNLLNLFWFYKMVSMFVRRYKQRNQNKQKKSS
ncbi:DUF887-domain-containing protein [Neoconidiobolus thromboides FSU 785]|nr:DUF887-domain-containing protein [Neoconidiobolus thromboides FSU 785]